MTNVVRESDRQFVLQPVNYWAEAQFVCAKAHSSLNTQDFFKASYKALPAIVDT